MMSFFYGLVIDLNFSLKVTFSYNNPIKSKIFTIEKLAYK